MSPYQLAEEADVSIRIYDSRMVQMLSLGRKDVGLYMTKDRAAYWNGRNDAGEPVASGAYFYELISGNFRSVKKMVVLK